MGLGWDKQEEHLHHPTENFNIGAKMTTWHSTQYPGIRYREHKSRKHNGKTDRYFAIRYKCNGKSREESVGWMSEGMNAQKANKIRAEIVHNIREGLSPQSLREKREIEVSRREKEIKNQKTKKIERITFEEVAKKFIEWAKTNKKSWKDDEQRIKTHLAPALSNYPLKDISPFQLEKLKSNLQKKNLSPKTVHHCLSLVRTIYTKALSWGLYSGTVPTNQISFPKINNMRTRFLTHQEATLLLEDILPRSKDAHDICVLALHCGLRFGEIAALTKGDLDFQNGIIHIREPKNGESRHAYMTKEVNHLLLGRIKEVLGSQELIFPDKNGNKRKTAHDSFKYSVERLGFNNGKQDRCTKVVFHTLRHTFASWLAINGTPLYTIKELMGHKTIVMTERYAHLILDHKRVAVVKMIEQFETLKHHSIKEENSHKITQKYFYE